MKTETTGALRSSPSTLRYHVTALEMTIYFNKEGDHDHNGLIFALTKNVPILKYIRALASSGVPGSGGEDDPYKFQADAVARAVQLSLEWPSLIKLDDAEALKNEQAKARQPHPLVRPLVLRARLEDRVVVDLQNEIRKRRVGIHLVGDGYDVKTNDGSHVGKNNSSLVAYGEHRTYAWQCNHEGVFPFHDGGNYSGGEDGTNVHGLFGALVVEPPGAIWRDPVTGRASVDQHGNFRELDGLYLDIVPDGRLSAEESGGSDTTLDTHKWPDPVAYPDFNKDSHREFVIFFHDEPEFLPPHGHLAENPCKVPGDQQNKEGADKGSGTGAGAGEHGSNGGHEDLPIMPISYRAEPMINRERILWERISKGDVPSPPVLNEEQHHSSWMFGDPATPILKAYIGDPVRIRLLHAAVKETHVFHLHVYEWHAVPQDRESPRIDAISISPQTGHTIEPIWGAGNRQQIAGDVIWHCHLYPHFHEGMWGIFRTFETMQDGKVGDPIDNTNSIYAGRRIGRYPDGTPIENLLPLPNRVPPPAPTPKKPGFPLYIPGTVKQKSPRPPWPDRQLQEGEKNPCGLPSLLAADMPPDFDYRATPTNLEHEAFNDRPVPGEMFTRNRFSKQQEKQWSECPEFQWNEDEGIEGKEVCRDVVVAEMDIEYNGHGWHDKDGHLYYLAAEGHPNTRPGVKEPLFFRANHGQIVNLILKNDLPPRIEETQFDLAFPPCDALPWQGECGMHVHMVKFDPVCGDGASVGWNYISGPTFGNKMVYRWWADQEFGTIFFHDHLFANYRQKHGLFGALIVEPAGAKYFSNFSNQKIVSGLQARIQLRKPVQDKLWFREFCLGIGDFIPMWNRQNNPLNPPGHPGGHGDQGVMALNYRNAPIRERLGDPKEDAKYDPANWFSSDAHKDPYTTIFATFENDPIWIRIVQGSHEEQHSFQIHGMRWRRFRVILGSTILNQQTFGLAEAFTFINHETYKPGDYLYKLSGADDLWLGCWGIIRAFDANYSKEDRPFPLEAQTANTANEATPPAEPPAGAKVRRFHVVAEPRCLTYHEPDLIDPFGLIYRLVCVESLNGKKKMIDVSPKPEPLVLRCREGEWVQVILKNELPNNLEPEPFAPEVPVEERAPLSFRPDRPVSSQVSMHADLLRYDVNENDGANIGKNKPQTVAPGDTRTYSWHAVRPLDPGSNAGEPLGPVLLQDMADVRNHRHHGLIGALIVEASDATPFAVGKNKKTAGQGASEKWHGSRVTVVTGTERFEEVVLMLQDGLRLYLNGNINFPAPDDAPGHGEDELDDEDQGQKGFNYRTEPVWSHAHAMSGVHKRPENALAIPNPATPVWRVPVGEKVHLHLVGACDKPRNHSFTIHGVTWPEWRFLSEDKQPRVASESAISCGTVRTFQFTPQNKGDHAYRSGALKWAVSQGLWGILRVVGKSGEYNVNDIFRRHGIVAASVGLILGLGYLALRHAAKGQKQDMV